MRRLICILAATGFMLSSAGNAATYCAPRESVLQSAWRGYGERPVAIGLDAGGAVLEVLAGRDGASFTVLRTSPAGISCVVMTGESWRSKGWSPPPEAEPES